MLEKMGIYGGKKANIGYTEFPCVSWNAQVHIDAAAMLSHYVHHNMQVQKQTAGQQQTGTLADGTPVLSSQHRPRFCDLCGISLRGASCQTCTGCKRRYCDICTQREPIPRHSGKPIWCYFCAKAEYESTHMSKLPKALHHRYDDARYDQVDDSDPDKDWQV